MNNLNKKQKIILLILAIIILLAIYIFFYYKEYSNFNQMQQNEFVIPEEESEKENKTNNKSEEKIKVHISGAVNKEGVIELSLNSRISDAIEKAEGLRNDAYIDEVNLAYILEDGMKIHIPTVEEKNKIEQEEKNNKLVEEKVNNYITTSIDKNSEKSNNISNNTSPKGKVNINTANQSELETLPGIGPSTANKIIDYRKENGKFNNIEDLKQVNGIGDAKWNKIKDLISVN